MFKLPNVYHPDCFHPVKSGSSVPQRVVFVEELSELLTEGLPDLWKLGQAYFNGTLIGDVCLVTFLLMLLCLSLTFCSKS